MFVWGVQILIKLQWEVHRAVRNYGESLTFAQSKNKQENRKMKKQQTKTQPHWQSLTLFILIMKICKWVCNLNAILSNYHG